MLLPLTLIGLVLAAPTHSEKPPSAEQYYAQAIEAMRDVPQPNFATYVVRVHTTGLGFILSRDPNGKADITMPLGRGNDASFSAAYRGSDGRTSVETPQGWGTIALPLFDPTWNGIYHWIRYGLNGQPDNATPTPLPTPGANGLQTIAAVRAMGVAFYSVGDAGAATCPNGDPAHRVHLVARRDPIDHPLTDAVIDVRTSRLCFIRMEMGQSIVAAGYNSSFELNIGDIDGEAVVRSGKIDVIARVAGIGIKSARVTFAYDHFAFPTRLAGDMFPGK